MNPQVTLEHNFLIYADYRVTFPAGCSLLVRVYNDHRTLPDAYGQDKDGHLCRTSIREQHEAEQAVRTALGIPQDIPAYI